MARTAEDSREDDARRRYADFLRSAGVDEGRVALEVLYLLPVEFVRAYRELYELCFSSDSGSARDNVKASGVGRSPMNTRSMSGAAGNGKKYYKGSWIIRSERALDEKRKLDRKLIRSGAAALGAARDSEDLVPDDRRGSDSAVRTCEECGKILSPAWIRCPFH
jgi:hypothetical protein